MKGIDPPGTEGLTAAGEPPVRQGQARAGAVPRMPGATRPDPRYRLNTRMPLFFTPCSQTASLGSLVSGSAVDIAPIGGKF
jgi:hypothetical protein